MISFPDWLAEDAVLKLNLGIHLSLFSLFRLPGVHFRPPPRLQGSERARDGRQGAATCCWLAWLYLFSSFWQQNWRKSFFTSGRIYQPTVAPDSGAFERRSLVRKVRTLLTLPATPATLDIWFYFFYFLF